MGMRGWFAAIVFLIGSGAAYAEGGGAENHEAAAPAGISQPETAMPASAKKGDRSSEFADEVLDLNRERIDGQLAARKSAILANGAALESFHRKTAQERIDAEQRMAEERKAFLLYLKSVPWADRRESLKNFEERQESQRKDFDKRQLAASKKWFGDALSDKWKSEPLSAQTLSKGQ